MEIIGNIIQTVWDFLSLENVLFTFMGKGISALELISTCTGLLCVFLATRGKVANFWVGYFYNIVLFLLFLQARLYSSMILQPISLAINFFGHYRWTHPRPEEENARRQLRISVFNGGQRIVVLGVVLIFTFFWGYILSRLDIWLPAAFSKATLPYFDAFVLGMVLMAQYLSAQKKLDCWGAWIIANVSNIILCMKAGFGFMPLVYAAYLLLAVGGFMMWRNQMKKERAEEGSGK